MTEDYLVLVLQLKIGVQNETCFKMRSVSPTLTSAGNLLVVMKLFKILPTLTPIF